jgi:murein DD-endopeptidase MepM/ murein hydrolase activator NlpD
MRLHALLLPLLAALLLLAAPASGDPGAEKARIDATIGRLQDQIARADSASGTLTSDISEATARIQAVQADIDAEQARLEALEAELAAKQIELAQLTTRLAHQDRRLEVLRAEHAAALRRLESRVRAIYLDETPDTLSFVLDAASFSELLDHVEYLNEIGRQDRRIATRVGRAKEAMAHARAETVRTRAGVGRATRELAARTTEQRGVRDRLVANRDALTAARNEKRALLGGIREDRADFTAEVESLQQESAALAVQIRGAQAGSPGSGVSASGLIWPVHGPVTSGFGVRWGRMHEGIDIAVPVGTPVVAAAAGTVIAAGWLGGYGNLVVIDHGNGLATAYGHNSSLAVGVGQTVAQGQVISYSGNTGHSTGPHVHFEVRVNGAAVDPVGYL